MLRVYAPKKSCLRFDLGIQSAVHNVHQCSGHEDGTYSIAEVRMNSPILTKRAGLRDAKQPHCPTVGSLRRYIPIQQAMPQPCVHFLVLPAAWSSCSWHSTVSVASRYMFAAIGRLLRLDLQHRPTHNTQLQVRTGQSSDACLA
jgi:hypothetical protein